MKEFSGAYFYSKLKPQKITINNRIVYIQGNPMRANWDDGADKWIEDTIRSIKHSGTQIETCLIERLKVTTGLYLLIVISNNRIFLVSDAISSYPVFYGNFRNQFFITDNLEAFQKENGAFRIDINRFEEFLAYGNVLGNRTLYQGVYRVQSGELVSIDEKEMESHRHFIFRPSKKPDFYKKQDDFISAFDKLFLSVFSRMVKNNPQVNNWLVPLSGGHDSRLVVNYLYRLGVKNVICFTYGIPNNTQAQISKQVAEALGYEWHFVEYTAEKWQALHSNGLFGEYIDYAFNGVSTPHIQDFLAIYELKQKGIFNSGDIFLPGHTVVTETETVFGNETLQLKNKESALTYVYSKILAMKRDLEDDSLMHDALSEMYDEANVEPRNFMAYCDWQERQSKYITNSVRAYEFFGFKNYQPMWDWEIFNFWMKMPVEKRVKRDPLYQLEKNGGLVEQLLEIPFASETKKSVKAALIKIVKRNIPESLLQRFLRLLKRKARLNEGLNQVFALSANSVKDMLEPIEDFPPNTQAYFIKFIDRYPYQVNPIILTTLYSIRRLLDKSKDSDN
ncbi:MULTISPECIES: asparagine synthase-related protein [unclassified Carboxylicivirga]|uniref:asparagine synthase-related protein n=1 Tax=Carboxylicivirga TaxID=1628153 RepID=UPI003D344AD9